VKTIIIFVEQGKIFILGFPTIFRPYFATRFHTVFRLQRLQVRGHSQSDIVAVSFTADATQAKIIYCVKEYFSELDNVLNYSSTSCLKLLVKSSRYHQQAQW